MNKVNDNLKRDAYLAPSIRVLNLANETTMLAGSGGGSGKTTTLTNEDAVYPDETQNDGISW
jgi:hypothetical protein